MAFRVCDRRHVGTDLKVRDDLFMNRTCNVRPLVPKQGGEHEAH